MVYTFLKILIRITLQFTYRRVEIVGREKIPKDKPVIFVSNHPSAYLEPIILATWIIRPLSFLINGSYWKVNKVFAWFLDQIHGIPIFKSEEGYNTIRDNEQTFQNCVDHIMKNKLLIIFAEGSNNQVRRLRPIKKGFAHIAFKAIEQHPDADIQIIPVGFCYSDPNIMRGDTSIIIGDPIAAQSYLSDGDNTVSFAKKLLDETRLVFEDLLPQITKEEEDQFEMLMHKQAAFGKSFTTQWKEAEEMLANGAEVDTTPIASHAKMLWEQNLSFADIVKSQQLTFWHKVVLVLGFIPAYVGKLLHYIPLQYSHTLTRKLIKRNEFYLSLRVAIVMFTMVILYTIVDLVSWFAFGTFWPPLILAGFGLFAIFYFDLFRIWKARKYQDLI